MMTDAARFQIDVEGTNQLCPAGEQYAAQQMRDGTIPVLCCEGPCIRGEIARQAAHRVAKHAPFARACQGEAMTVPKSGMARWVDGAAKVVVIDGCFLRCQARQMRSMLRPDQLIEIDALPLYKKYTELFAIDDVPEAERIAAAEQVAERVLEQLAPALVVTERHT
jgi:uncharacterized metal-binding protein